MKLLLLHGPGKISSRARLISLKQKFDPNNVVVFEEGSDFQDMMGGLVTIPLLQENRLIILENPPEDFIFDSFDSSDSLTLILWFDYEVTEKKPVMEWVKNVKGEVLYFPEGKEISVFPFLDFLAYGNKKAFLEMEKLKKANFDIFYFITMTYYLLRNLVVTSKNAPTFVKQKLEKQKKRFSQNDLENLYRDILKIEFKIKNGLLEIPQAEFLFVNKFITS